MIHNAYNVLCILMTLKRQPNFVQAPDEIQIKW